MRRQMPHIAVKFLIYFDHERKANVGAGSPGGTLAATGRSP
jgi:hypothetical protein